MANLPKRFNRLNRVFTFIEQENRTSILSEAHALLFWYYASLGALELAGERYRTLRRPLSEVLIPHFKVMTVVVVRHV